jgi:hypothetical protein
MASPKDRRRIVDTVFDLGDLDMLVNVGGRERTRADFQRLCATAGFCLDSVTAIPLPAAFSLLGASPSA